VKTTESLTNPCMVQNTYFSLQYSMFTNCGIEVIGGILFFITAIFIVRDKRRCEHAVVVMEQSQKPESRLMLAKYSPESSVGDELPSDDEDLPKLQLIYDSKSSTPSQNQLAV